MRKRTLSLLLPLSLVCAAPAFADGPPTPAQMYPRSAFLVSVADMAQLQQALDAHTVIRLAGGGDYTAAPPITLKSGYQIYGIGDKLPAITIAPGATGIIVTNVSVSGTGITFPASPMVTKNNLFLEISGGIAALSATLEQNSVIGLENGTVAIDTTAGGYLKNNRFIRIRAQSLTPLLVMKGDAAHQSFNNVFLWGNQLTQPEGAADIEGQRDVTIVNWDDEAYATPTTDPIYRFKDIDTLRLWTMSGNTSSTTEPDFDISVVEAQLSNVQMGGAYAMPLIALRAPVARALSFTSQTFSDDNATGFRLSGADNVTVGTQVFDDGAAVAAPLSAADQATLISMVAPTREGAPWERPTFDPVPDPAGANWNQNLAAKPDSTAMIQALLDAGPIAFLDPGTYYISAPLKIKTGAHLIGSGADTTVIIAKDPSIDMIVDDPSNMGAVYGMQIGDLTFQGGTNGVHFVGPPGVSRQYSQFLFSHVTFRDFSSAGFFIDQIFGLDNGFFDHVNFVGCGTGFKQYADPKADPGGPNSGYMDKVMFYQSQILQNGIGVDLSASRADNLNMFLSSLFQDNTMLAFRGTSQNNTSLVNSDLINNGGDPSVQGLTDVLSCYFRADTNGVAFLGGALQIDGTRFERGTSATAMIFENSDKTFFAPNNAWAWYSAEYMTNSSSDDIPFGNLEFGLLLNNSFQSRPDLSKPAVMAYQGKITTLADGTTKPVAQLLFGASYAPVQGTGGGGGGTMTGTGTGTGTGGGATSSGGGGGAASGNDAAGPESGGGCGCSVGDRAPFVFGVWSLFGAALLVARRRRRQRD